MTTRMPHQDLATCQSPYPIDLEDASEAARLTILSRVLAGHLDELVPRPLEHLLTMQVLDVGCGPGGWVHDVAYSYPKAEVVGLDLSQTMLGLARSGAQAQGLHNAFFERVDATQPLPFSDGTFDLVQARFCNSFLLASTWPAAVREWVRVTRPGGVVRILDCDGFGQSNDPQFEQLQHILRAAWEADPCGRVWPVQACLSSWLHQAGIVTTHSQAHVLDFSAPVPHKDHCAYEERWAYDAQYERNASMSEALTATFTLLQPFVLAHQRVPPATLEWLCQQVALNMRRSSFRAHFGCVEVVGRAPTHTTHP